MCGYIILQKFYVYILLICILVSVECQKGAYIKDSFSTIDGSTPIGSHLTESTEGKKILMTLSTSPPLEQECTISEPHWPEIEPFICCSTKGEFIDVLSWLSLPRDP